MSIPPFYDCPRKQSKTMKNGQLEMSFEVNRGCPRRDRRTRRRQRAQWWFAHMRQVVDRATDWQPAPSGRPEQIWFPNAHRQIAVAPVLEGVGGDSGCQVCE